MFNRESFKSLEFYASIITVLATWATSLVDSGTLGTHTAIYVTAAVATAYAVTRGLAKINVDTKNYWETTEFWGVVLAGATETLGAWQGLINVTAFKYLSGLLVLALMLNQGLRKQPLIQAGHAVLSYPDPAEDGDDTIHAG